MTDVDQDKYLVGVDIGGTFTDLVGLNLRTGDIALSKARSTPRDLTEGVVGCVSKAELSMARIDTLFHGSTIVINAIIERTGARTALITTRGFRDVLDIGRGNRPENYDLFYRKPEPLVPRRLRFEVTERVAADGAEIAPLSLSELQAAAEAASGAGVEAIAICFLHSYANDAHEEQARAHLRTLLPDVYVCTSSEVAREWREYERSSTTVMNAYVGPNVERYIGRLEDAAEQDGFAGHLYLMQSSGGVMTPARAKSYPVAMVESGPVAGMIGAAHVGALLGEDLVISFDMGGTTAKCSLIEGGMPKISQTYYVNGYTHGYPLQVPTIEVIEVGTGGGSLAWIDDAGGLKVGPHSAGSEPGPVCIGAGGTEPTVTDANVILGRINPDEYLSGEIGLDLAAARAAIDRKVAQPFGLGLEEAAAGILTIANANMALAVRGITIEKGVDPRNTTMVAFGGGGPLHAAAIARDIAIPRVVIPTLPGYFSALGMLLADMRHDLVQTCVRPFPDCDLDEVNRLLVEMSEDGAERLRAAGIPDAEVECGLALDLRYVGQQWTLSTPVVGERITRDNAGAVRVEFNRLYEVRFGHSFTNIPTEIVNVRVVAVGRRRKPEFAHLEQRFGGQPPSGSREVFVEPGGFVACPIYRREDLLSGDRIEGPAVIEEGNCTTVLNPGDVAGIDRRGFIVIDINGRDQ